MERAQLYTLLFCFAVQNTTGYQLITTDANRIKDLEKITLDLQSQVQQLMRQQRAQNIKMERMEALTKYCEKMCKRVETEENDLVVNENLTNKLMPDYVKSDVLNSTQNVHQRRKRIALNSRIDMQQKPLVNAGNYLLSSFSTLFVIRHIILGSDLGTVMIWYSIIQPNCNQRRYKPSIFLKNSTFTIVCLTPESE